MARRNDLDICANILRVSRVGAKKTRIVYRVNLNFKIVEKYLRRLLESELFCEEDDRHFFTTRKGVEFLRQYRRLVVRVNQQEIPRGI